MIVVIVCYYNDMSKPGSKLGSLSTKRDMGLAFLKLSPNCRSEATKRWRQCSKSDYVGFEM